MGIGARSNKIPAVIDTVPDAIASMVETVTNEHIIGIFIIPSSMAVFDFKEGSMIRIRAIPPGTVPVDVPNSPSVLVPAHSLTEINNDCCSE